MHICDNCGKEFALPADLRRHQTREAGRLEFGCDTCGLKVKSKEALKDHVTKHVDSDIKRHQCRASHYENTPIQIYGKFYHQKNENFQIKKCYIFHISAQNIDCGYSLEPPRQCGSNEYP